MEEIVTRPWGTYQTIIRSDTYQVKRIIVNPNSQLSLQSHNHRAEHWIIVEGTAEITLDDKVFNAPQNTPIFIGVGQKHRIANRTTTPVIFIEVQTGKTLDENDIVRLEDNYGRV